MARRPTVAQYARFEPMALDLCAPADLETERERKDWSIEVTGRAVHRRNVSRRLVFLDLIEDAPDPGPIRVELVIKPTFSENETDDDVEALIRMARQTVRLGDVVRARGRFDSAPSENLILLRCETIMIERRWAEERPGVPFDPLPVGSLVRKPAEAPPLPEFAAMMAPTGEHSDSDSDENTASAQPTAVPHCKYWLNSGRCPRAECAFRHADGEQLMGLRTRFVETRVQRRLVETRLPDDPFLPSEHASRHQRAERFVEWLEREFALQPGRDMVLDVAGGRGDVTFHLALRGVRSVLIDPRPRNLTPQQEIKLAEARVSLPAQLCRLFDDDLLASTEHAPLLAATTAIVGMHPDQATEPIVDFALARGIPFAVLPCCVFPSLFPGRHLADGTPVVTYTQFVDYLQAKHAGIQRVFLPFRGRNLVLAWKPTLPEAPLF